MRNAEGLRENKIATDNYYELLSVLWDKINQSDKNKALSGLKDLWKMSSKSNGGMSHEICRRCWFKCREDPLLFYLGYIEGEKEAIQLYELASMYDNAAYSSEDSIEEKEVIEVLKKVIEAIKIYNKENKINDSEAIKIVNTYIDNRIKYMKNFEKEYRKKEK